jgi:hypothetical protein
LFGKPYARRSGELGDRERERDGGDLSEGTLEERPRPIEDEAECDLDGRDPQYGWDMNPVSGARVDAVVIAVKGGYEYVDTWGRTMGDEWPDHGECDRYGESITCR